MMVLDPEQNALVNRAKAYPFGTPTSSYLFVHGECWPVDWYDESLPERSIVRLNNKKASARDLFLSKSLRTSYLATPRIPVLASGSNASPARLKEKFHSELQQTVIPVILYSIKNLLPVFSAKFASYGSITATLQQACGNETKMFVTFLSLKQLELMHQTEAIGDEYDFARFSHVDIRQEPSEPTPQKTVYAYLSRKGVFTIGGHQFSLDSRSALTNGFSHRSQITMLTQARDLLSPQEELDHFILKNITEEKVRRANNALLRKFSQPFSGGNTELVRESPSSLFY
ncbi:MAG: hypothetical protein CMM32_09665 [Rhodospirillaceae bacterium]|nr:hypothetical protein [Rhodospirillaceae bacterium]|tara:strand:+ start:638 stop:1495 length:858 start_codon:yes stop_codon:yes gene_type:complete